MVTKPAAEPRPIWQELSAETLFNGYLAHTTELQQRKRPVSLTLKQGEWYHELGVQAGVRRVAVCAVGELYLLQVMHRKLVGDRYVSRFTMFEKLNLLGYPTWYLCGLSDGFEGVTINRRCLLAQAAHQQDAYDAGKRVGLTVTGFLLAYQGTTWMREPHTSQEQGAS